MLANSVFLGLALKPQKAEAFLPSPTEIAHFILQVGRAIVDVAAFVFEKVIWAIDYADKQIKRLENLKIIVKNLTAYWI